MDRVVVFGAGGRSAYLILDQELDTLNGSCGRFLVIVSDLMGWRRRHVILTETAAETPPIKKSTTKPGICTSRSASALVECVRIDEDSLKLEAIVSAISEAR